MMLFLEDLRIVLMKLTNTGGKMASDNLTQKEAQIRASLVSNVHYKVEVDITDAGKRQNNGELTPTFLSSTTINFDYALDEEELDFTQLKHGTFLDLRAEEVLEIRINNKLYNSTLFENNRIKLPKTALQKRNEVVVKALCQYMNTGEGLHRYEAEDEGNVYLYTQFEVADSRRVFAVFEQPDIKAHFDFRIAAPNDWIVTSTQSPISKKVKQLHNVKTDKAKNYTLWKFDTTPKMSSYLTSIIAGPFKVWKTTHKVDKRELEMKILARQSLAEFVDYDYIFDITKKGFDFYGNLFNLPFPYDKYDQIFMPEFNAGAMENIGNVTYREDYIFNVAVSGSTKERRVVTILHELAHMWFGNLVTMKWWNDLWLNESFAEYISTYATGLISEYKNAAVTFNVSEKAWGMVQDQLSSTHPIVADIKDLNDVLVNFDGITYAKGAAVLETLTNFVGHKKFFEGVGNYLRKFSYKNATLYDLLTELEASSGKDLKNWSKYWLETAGLNTFRADFDNYTLIQTATEEYPTLRPHNIKIGLYRFDEATGTNDDVNKDTITATGTLNLRGAKLVRFDQYSFDVPAEAQISLDALRAADPYDLAVVNDEGTTFAKIRPDSRSLKTALKYAHKIEDPLARCLILDQVWNTARDGLLPVEDYIDMIFKVIASETESSIRDKSLKNLVIAIFQYIPPSQYDQILKSVGSNLWNLAKDATAGSDAQYQFLLYFTKFATTGDHILILQNLLSGTFELKGFKLDEKIEWELRTALSRLGAFDKHALILLQKENKSEHAKLGSLTALAAIPTLENKKLVFENACSEFSTLSNSELVATATGLVDVTNNLLLESFVHEYFASINQIWNTKDFAIAENIIVGFYPARLASLELAQLGERWLEENDRQSDALKRLVKENLDITKRALKVQKTLK
jgi:aminopeptidase N